MGSDHCPSLRKTTAAATTAISTISITTTITAITYLWMCTANHNHITWDRIVVLQNDYITNLKITDICICKKIINWKSLTIPKTDHFVHKYLDVTIRIFTFPNC